jgi:purine-binding chemotaxis protein CheW
MRSRPAFITTTVAELEILMQNLTTQHSGSDDPASYLMATENLDEMYLCFSLGEEEYAVGIRQVAEIIGLPRIMAVPDLPDYVRGVINLRGKVIPLLDVRLRFRMPERSYDDRTVVIVMDVDDAPIGLIVDGVTEVREVPAADMRPSKGLAQRGAQSAIAGLGRVGDRVIVVLDASVLTSDHEIIMADASGETGGDI